MVSSADFEEIEDSLEVQWCRGGEEGLKYHTFLCVIFFLNCGSSPESCKCSLSAEQENRQSTEKFSSQQSLNIVTTHHEIDEDRIHHRG